MATNREEKLLKAMYRANQELGVPTDDYPAPVANASRIITEAIGQHTLDLAEGVHSAGNVRVPTYIVCPWCHKNFEIQSGDDAPEDPTEPNSSQVLQVAEDSEFQTALAIYGDKRERRPSPEWGAEFATWQTTLEQMAYEVARHALKAAEVSNTPEVTRLRTAILDIDAHAAPLGEDAQGFVTGGYVVSVGALHRALGIIGHTAPKCEGCPECFPVSNEQT